MAIPNGNDNESTEGPAWAIAHSSLDQEDVCLAIRTCGKLFYLETHVDELGDWSERERFRELLENAQDDPDAEEDLYDLIWQRLLPLVHDLKREDEHGPSALSLQDFYGAEIVTVKFDSSLANPRYAPVPADNAPINQLRPQVKLKDIPNAAQVFQIDASKVQIMPGNLKDYDIASDTPTLVSLSNSKSRYHFKAAQDPTSFLRELQILQQLAEHRLNKKYRLPVLHGLVTYSDDPDTVMGFLLELIDQKNTMLNMVTCHKPSQRLKQQWFDQIKDTVRALHKKGIVWGDVKPDNVLIDHDQHAWIIDFGGGYNSGYVDQNVMETIEGDQQGISRMGELLFQGRRY